MAAGALATWRGALWPFDARATAIVTAGGMAVVFTGWGPVWAVPFLAAFMLQHHRLALWVASVVAMLALHGVLGPSRGFAPLGDMGLLAGLVLYAAPMAVIILLGGLMRALVFPTRKELSY